MRMYDSLEMDGPLGYKLIIFLDKWMDNTALNCFIQQPPPLIIKRFGPINRFRDIAGFFVFSQ